MWAVTRGPELRGADRLFSSRGAGNEGVNARCISSRATDGGVYTYVGWQYYSADAGLTVDEWNHIVVAFNDEVGETYKNGILIGRYDGFLPTTVQFPLLAPFTFGGDFPISDPEREFNGDIDDVMFFDRALTHDEISLLYNKSVEQHKTGAPWRV